MKKLVLGISLAAMAIAGSAYAAQDATPRPRADADGNGTVTRAEAQAQATQMFTRMDMNKDGKLDQADRQAHMTAMRSAMFDKIDTNKDGQISRAEFDAHHPMRGPGMPGAEGPGHDMGRMGGERGMGGHGMGGEHAMGGAEGGPGRGMMQMARMADANKDNAISQAEFMAAATQRFDRSDANKDGQVTQQERNAARAAMRGGMRGHKGHGRGGMNHDGMMGHDAPPPPPPAK